MSKVLLIFEDYSLLSKTQADLKKAGLETSAVTSEFSILEQIFSFKPDLVVAMGKGPKVSTLGVGRKLKDMFRWQGKVLLIFPSGVKPAHDDLLQIRMDMMLEAPIQSTRLIQVCAHLMGLNEQDLVRKFTVAMNAEAERVADRERQKEVSDKISVTGKVGLKSSSSTGSGQMSDDPMAAFDQAANSWGKKSPAVGGEAWIDKAAQQKEALEAKNSIMVTGGQEERTKTQVQSEPVATSESTPVSDTNLNPEGSSASFVGGGISSSEQSAASIEIEKPRNGARSISVSDPVSVDQNSSAVNDYSVSRDPEMDEVIANVAQELAGARMGERERTSQYKQFTKGISVSPKSTLGRKNAKERLNKLKKDWSQQELDDQDANRRQFTRALFKKK